MMGGVMEVEKHRKKLFIYCSIGHIEISAWFVLLGKDSSLNWFTTATSNQADTVTYGATLCRCFSRLQMVLWGI